jgi:non-specific serine/threonine protein kinase
MAGPVKPDGYLDRVLQARGILEGPNPESWYDRLEREESDLEEALEAASQNDPALGLRVTPLLQRFWFARGRLERGRMWIERLLAAAGDRPTLERGQGLFAAAALAFRQGDTDATRRYATEALVLAKQFGAPELQIDAALALARVGLREGDAQAVRQHAETARQLAQEIADEGRELGAIHHLAEGARIAGDYRWARTLYDESLARNRARGSRLMVSVELTNLALVEKKEGNLSRAEANLREAIGISGELNNSYLLAANLVALAAVAASAGTPQKAARILGRADAIYSATGLVVDPADKPEYDGALAAARAQLGQDQFQAAYEEGARSTVDELVR